MHDDGSTHQSPTADRPPLAKDPAARPLGVLLGFDASEHSVRALYYAARAAQRLGSRLTVITAFTVPAMAYADPTLVPSVPAEVARHTAAKELLEVAHEHLRDYPGEVDLRAEHGDAAGVLVDLSAQAQLAVVGARGLGGFLGRLLGSVSSALPAHAFCPTVVVPEQYEIDTSEGAGRFAPMQFDEPVVAGVDLYQLNQLAMDYAAQEARRRMAPLQLLAVMPRPDAWGTAYMAWLPDANILERHQQELAKELDEVIESLRESYPDLTISGKAMVAEPAPSLLDATKTAQLTVLGTRGHGRVVSTLLGSVSRAVLAKAEGPVMVVPPTAPAAAAAAADSAASDSPHPR